MTEKATSSIIVTDSMPAPVMNALQLRASPFTLATGNYSLSEAIEHGQLASYETQIFNPGVVADYEWQLENAMRHLDVDQDLHKAVMALVSPSGLEKKVAQIRLVLQHPDQIKRIMTELRANTDIKKLLVAAWSRPTGVRVMVIEPGAVATELTGHITHSGAKQAAEQMYKEAITADDIAGVIAFAVTRPRRMTLNEILVRLTAQP